MSLSSKELWEQLMSFPRASGDEPSAVTVGSARYAFSPRERG